MKSGPAAKAPTLSPWAQLSLVLAPVVAAYLILWRLVTPIPLFDDYWHLFAFALDYVKAPDAASRLHVLLFTQVGPYKLVFEHSLLVLELGLLHHLNFPLLILLGNLSVLGIFALLWKATVEVCPAARRWPLLLLPVAALLFSLNYADTLDWAISGLQQPMVILFSLAALYFLARRSGWRSVVVACVFAMLSCATYANGMLLWPTGLLVFTLERPVRWRALMAWCAVGAGTSAVYLLHYQTTGLTAPQSIARKLLFFVMFCGSALENMHHWPVPYISVLIGAAVLAVLAVSVRSRFYRRSPFLFAAMIWILLTAAEVANARIAMGLNVSLASRYKLYCDLLLIIAYVYLLDRVLRDRELASLREIRRFLVPAIAAALLVCVAGDLGGIRFYITRRGRAEAALRGYFAAPQRNSPIYIVGEPLPGDLEKQQAARVQLTEAIRLGVYTPPQLPQ